MAAPLADIPFNRGACASLHMEYPFAGHLGDHGGIVVQSQHMEAVETHPQSGVVDVSDDAPGSSSCAYEYVPRARLRTRSREFSALLGAACHGVQLLRSEIVIVESPRGSRRAAHQDAGAELCQQVELPLGVTQAGAEGSGGTVSRETAAPPRPTDRGPQPSRPVGSSSTCAPRSRSSRRTTLTSNQLGRHPPDWESDRKKPRLNHIGGSMTHRIEWNQVSAEDVVRAIEDYDRLGADQFFSVHGAPPRPRPTELIHENQVYPPKAILGTAYEFATGTRLSSGEFEGGKAGAVRVLHELGFTVEPQQPA